VVVNWQCHNDGYQDPALSPVMDQAELLQPPAKRQQHRLKLLARLQVRPPQVPRPQLPAPLLTMLNVEGKHN
jgi:hypothetical protein